MHTHTHTHTTLETPMDINKNKIYKTGTKTLWGGVPSQETDVGKNPGFTPQRGNQNCHPWGGVPIPILR